jgi:hypothetical protein
MLTSMSETSWGDVDMSELPTGTVTLLLADVEGSTRLWEWYPRGLRRWSKTVDYLPRLRFPPQELIHRPFGNGKIRTEHQHHVSSDRARSTARR